MKLYISNYLSNSISILDYKDFKAEEILLEDGTYPHHFCINKKRKIMYLPSSSNGTMYILDLELKKIIDSMSIGGNLSQIGISKGDLYISNEDSNSIYIINEQTLEPIGIIGVGETPHGFDFNEKENKLYVPCKNSIYCIDTLSKCIDREIKIDFKSWHIKVDIKKNEVYVSTLDGSVIVLDGFNMKIKHIINQFLIPVEICFNYSKSEVYIADLGYKKVVILDYNNLEIKNKIEINGNPQGLAISRNEELLFVSDTQNNSLKVYNTTNHMFINEIKTGKEPTTIICL